MTREEAEIYAKTMTYEDALYNLSQARAIPYRKATFIKVNELIQALSQQPTDDKCHYCEHNFTPYKGNTGEFTEQEPCDYAVSREAVYQLLMNMASSAYGFEEIRRIVDELPSVTQKSGKWIRSLIYENTYNCSKCGSAGYDTFKYCPNCGAKMESEE